MESRDLIKDFWAEIKDDLMRFIYETHQNGRLTKAIKWNFTTLTPKVDSPRHLTNFRPISLVSIVISSI